MLLMRKICGYNSELAVLDQDFGVFCTDTEVKAGCKLNTAFGPLNDARLPTLPQP